MLAPYVSGRRSDSPALVIVLTDGKSQEEPAVVSAAGERLREDGTRVFVLGITTAVDDSQLHAIAGPKGHVFLKDAFEQLGPEAFVELGLDTICPGV